jgi:hypothetical protein
MSDDTTFWYGTNPIITRAMHRDSQESQNKREAANPKPIEYVPMPKIESDIPEKYRHRVELLQGPSDEYTAGWEARRKYVSTYEVVTKRELRTLRKQLERREAEIKRREKELMIRRTRKEYEEKLVKLLGKKAVLKKQLGSLNPNKAKDMKTIAAINFQLKDVDEQIHDIQQESGINLEEAETGSRLDRFVAYLKKQKDKIVKNVKSVWKKYKEVIISAGLVVVSIVSRIFLRKLATA